MKTCKVPPSPCSELQNWTRPADSVDHQESWRSAADDAELPYRRGRDCRKCWLEEGKNRMRKKKMMATMASSSIRRVRWRFRRAPRWFPCTFPSPPATRLHIIINISIIINIIIIITIDTSLSSAIFFRYYPVYTTKHTWSKHEANVFKTDVHDVCSKFASCLLHRVNTPYLRKVRNKQPM